MSANAGVPVDPLAGPDQEGAGKVISLKLGQVLFLQEIGGEAWAYQEPVAVFIGVDFLLGGLPELLHWAAESFGYHDPCSLAEYQTQATQAYNDHISNPEVILSHL